MSKENQLKTQENISKIFQEQIENRFNYKYQQLHAEICAPYYFSTSVNFDASNTINWLRRLENINKENSFFDPNLFQKQIANVWLRYCYFFLPSDKKILWSFYSTQLAFKLNFSQQVRFIGSFFKNRIFK